MVPGQRKWLGNRVNIREVTQCLTQIEGRHEKELATTMWGLEDHGIGKHLKRMVNTEDTTAQIKKEIIKSVTYFGRQQESEQMQRRSSEYF